MQPDAKLPKRPWQLAGVLAGVMSLSAGLLSPVAPPALQWRYQSKLETRAAPVAYLTTMVVEQTKRKVYPYSIVPGGAENLREAKREMAEPAIKAHYANVNLAQLQQVKLATNLTGYVSYRWGDKIYWTKKRLTLRAGETVFTDGKNIVRGRCLNCYSAFPMLPVRPNEPSANIMDTPVEMPVTVYSFPKLPVLAPELPIPPGELTPIVPAIVPTLVSTVGKTGGIWFPLVPIIPPIHHHPSHPGSPTFPVVPPVVPPVAIVPEPHYGWALALGLFVMAFGHYLRRRAL
jgi:hypothetical protein